ncbi:secreted peptidase [Deinococcus maricopensis DSM 21211]|uniref:Secreted peptidase n=2 Tax=Deinococcus TaxID=1298 RepID=E8UA10_DEIML|nr:secreted peptidase [Deinococcus maricopensis DSM 21211]
MLKRMLSAAAISMVAILSACNQTAVVPTSTDAPVAATPAKGVDQQIVYGTVSAYGSRPYQVAVLPSTRPNSAYCGGTLIGSNWVMTAAHCVYGASASSRIVRAGVYTLSNSTEGQKLNVAQIYVHPNYRSSADSYDIALLRLSSAVTTSAAKPAALPSNSVESVLDVDGKYAVVSGWGITESGSASDKLREVSIPISPTSGDCGSRPGNTICGKYASGKDSCNGDSGGPLAQTYNSKFYVLGIVSYGPTECRGYGVYTRVNGYLSWIQSVSGITAQ